MYSKEQIEKSWARTIESQNSTHVSMRSSCPTARDTQSSINNMITFVATDMIKDMMPKMQEVFFKLLDLPATQAQAKNDKIHSTLTKLGINQNYGTDWNC